MTLTCPGPVAGTNSMIATMLRDNALHNTTIQRFQQTMKCGRKKGHGRPRKSMFGDNDFGPKQRLCLLCNYLTTKNPGQQCAKAGMTGKKNGKIEIEDTRPGCGKKAGAVMA